jgi:hypothetical protein
LPHAKAPAIGGFFKGQEFAFADFRYLPIRCKFIAVMPQWDFLNFLAERGLIIRRFICACAPRPPI